MLTRQRVLLAWLFALLIVANGLALAQGLASRLPVAAQPAFQAVTVAQHRAHLDELRSLVADCARVVTNCDVGRVGSDDRVQPVVGPAFTARFAWLRNLIDDSGDTDHHIRAANLPAAAQRLEEQEADLDAAPAVPVLTLEQSEARSAVLARAEFRTTQDYSLTDRFIQFLNTQLGRMFGGASNFARRVPWFGTAVQWATLMLTAALLLVWVVRTLDRQRVALGRLAAPSNLSAAAAESRDWFNRAQAHAAATQWRDAVHCLYWASIITLEDRRLLRPNRTRTPREALRLIDRDSTAREPLHAQTAAFERIWYGMHPAQADDFHAAEASYRALQTGGTSR